MTHHTPHDHDGEASRPPDDADLTYEIDDQEPPSLAVVRAVASLTNTRVIDLDPLYDVIDPDHLDGLVGDCQAESAFADSGLTFHAYGCRVTVTGGVVHVEAREHDVDR